MGIGETLRRAPAKLIMRADGDQAKTVCGNLQLGAGLEAGIEGATHTVGQRRLERLQRKWQEGKEAEDAEEEEGSGRVAAALNNLRIMTAGTQEEAVEQLEASLEMEVEETGES